MAAQLFKIMVCKLYFNKPETQYIIDITSKIKISTVPWPSK